VSEQPLAGVRVVDLTTVLMGPFATQVLADYGADVVKVEPPEGDPVRGIGPARHPGMGAIFLQANRNKRSVVLDLRKAEGLALLKELAATADIFAYNLRPQAMEKLGLGYEALQAANPRLVYLGMFGFARRGPYAFKAAYDDLIQGLAGIPALSLIAGASEPRYAPLAIADRVTGLAAVNAALLALLRRGRTGRGEAIDVTMFESMARMVLGDHLGGDTFIPRHGEPVYPRLVARDRRPYRTKDGWICVVVYSDRQWRAFFRAIGREAEFDADPRLSDISRRTQNIGALYERVAQALEERTTDEWLEALGRADIPAMPMLAVDELLADPQLRAAGLFHEIEHPSEGRLRALADGTQWAAPAFALRRPAPRLGEHSAEVLASLGRGESEIAALAAGGVTRLDTSTR
jgi:crotonobetainyl-CoA:carnitine CoA-transferase CaiB-like acyl-CoA transferase